MGKLLHQIHTVLLVFSLIDCYYQLYLDHVKCIFKPPTIPSSVGKIFCVCEYLSLISYIFARFFLKLDSELKSQVISYFS